MVSRETAVPTGFRHSVEAALDNLRSEGLLRSPLVAARAGGPVIEIDGREVINLCSNDYLGFSTHSALASAIRTASPNHGAGASRHIGGTDAAHRQLESELAAFVARPSALLFSTGYAANLGALQATLGPGDIVFSDELNHASIVDGCRLSRAKTIVYPHLDLATLAASLAKHRSAHRTALIVSESIFSMDGDLAPLPRLRALADQHQTGLMVDEAHALGVLGPEGRGLCAQTQTTPDLLVGTLGKAFGSAGAFVAAERDTILLLENRARSFVFSTATQPLTTAAPLAAIPLVRGADQARTRVIRHVARLREALASLGYPVPSIVSHILPARTGSPEATMRLSAELLSRGVFVHGVRPPTVPQGTSRLRITASAAHTDEQIEEAISVFPRFL